jgi:hypothetical protein
LLESRASHILDALSGLDGVKAARHVPEIANCVPHVQIELDPLRCGLTGREAASRLLDGDPPIAVSQRGDKGLLISVWMMRGNEHRVVAKRLRELLRAASPRT